MSFTFSLPPPTGYTLHQWFAVLKLATAWEFSDIRTLAMKSMILDKTRVYGIGQWFGIFESCWNLDDYTEPRELAITRVSSLQKWSAMQKINNGRWYCVRQWASTEGLKDLAEAECSGFQTMDLLSLREVISKPCPHCESGDFWCSY
ncbi:hypothetical protein E1B28_010275 [Marasmius oreades]|uniref:Uncharacterized protein n=1 Tax=Marasmius oreades TaxID=181124 RepID=A0A9P7RWQ5_9AGAR|nr:uncharacterized protein E1B28_010275 [Marasmius oreades]KAG7091224.1 hypothetical protein E1B28_010275 [Marasmius oreades]